MEVLPVEEPQKTRKTFADAIRQLPPIPFALLSLGFLFVSYQLVGGVLALLVVGLRPGVEDALAFRLTTMFGQIIFLLLPTIYLSRLRFGKISAVPLTLPNLRMVLAIVVSVVALQQVLQGYMALQESIPLPEVVNKIVKQMQDMMEGMYLLLIASTSLGEFLLVVLVVAVTPAICEEVLFRGLVQRSFEERIGGLPAAIVAGIIFGVFHLNPFSIVAVTILGVYFGFVVYRTNNLTVSIIAHGVNNFLACAAIYFFSADELYLLQFLGERGEVNLWLNSLLFGVVFLVATSYVVHATKPAAHHPPAQPRL